MAKSTSKLFPDEEKKSKVKKITENLPANEDTELDTVGEQKEVADIPADDIQDIDLSVIKKKRFRINGDPKKILELNTSDLNIVSRLSTAYEQLQKDMEEVGKILAGLPDEEEASDEVENLAYQQLGKIDASMKEKIDYIFDAPVSAICSDGGSMYDPFEGSFRYEHVIEAILRLYERNLDKEFNQMKKRVSVKTSKYTKKYHN